MEHSEATLPFPYATVILDLSLDKALDYAIPKELASQVKKGVKVEVKVRGQKRHGVVLALSKTSPYPTLQPILNVLSDDALLTEELFELGLWMSKYYATPLSRIFKVMLPSSVRGNMTHKEQFSVMRSKTREEIREHCVNLGDKHPAQRAILEVMLLAKKEILLTALLEKAAASRSPVDALVKQGWLKIERVRIDRSPLIDEEYFKTGKKILSQEQQESYEKIIQSLSADHFETHLLYGVTGSGKTEVYLQAIEKALELKKSTLMLVPEISLTQQTIERFKSRFEEKIAILHHRLSHGERFDEWHRIRRGEATIVVGARSALFCPLHNLGLIIVDEEHDGAYKQSEEMPCYHARDVAVMRGKMRGATVILGSATPSMETFANAQSGKYRLSTLRHRPAGATLPTVRIIDMKLEREKGSTTFSGRLIDGIKERLERGEQTILFLNRRGYFTTQTCPQCGTVSKCPHCDTSLTFHKGENKLACHLCDYTLCPPPQQCQTCRSAEPLKFRGIGTEHVEKQLHALFPEARTLRIDSDTTRHKGSLEAHLKNFSTGKSDILIGTQMISKGLHFPLVTLVALLNCDTSLHIPDFRASEHTFQLITQVAGRSGRGELKGEVILQTNNPENQTIQLASHLDYDAFYAHEMSSRSLFHYPPKTHLVKFLFTGPDAKQAEEAGKSLHNALQRHLGHHFTLHPLLPAGHPKIKDIYRFQFLVRGPAISPIHQAHEKAHLTIRRPSTVRCLIDVDPTSTFF